MRAVDWSAYHKVAQRIARLLDEHECWYETFEHEPVRTSEEAAKVRSGYSLSEGGKALIVRIKKGGEKTFAQIVVPGDARFDAKKTRAALGASDIRFATEEEVADITGGVLPGGVPPFGTLFGLTVYADSSIFEKEKMIFNAGDRSFSIGIKTEDYRRVVKPVVVDVV